MGSKRDLDPRKLGRRLASARAVLLPDRVDASNASPILVDPMIESRLPRMDAAQTQTIALEAECRRQLIIRRIDAALARIESGEYGYCETCRAPIAQDRLENEPTVATCIRCAGLGR